MRASLAVILALVLVPGAPLAQAQTLAPGKPAGIGQAQMNNHQLFIYITLGGTVAMVAAGLLMLKKSKTTAAVSSPVTTTTTTS